MGTMRVLVVFHGWLPQADRPISGGALRGWHHGEALKAAGHEVLYTTRDQDALEGGPPVFQSPAALRTYAKAVKPDRILCVQPEEAPALAGLDIPVCLDLYAPRLLESVFEESTSIEAVRTLRALSAADHFLFSNPRQRWFYLGLLTLAGVDVREVTGDVVPLVAPAAPKRQDPKTPQFVMGGVAWPWQDPTVGLERTVKYLRKRRKGKVVVFGGKPAIGTTQVVDLPAQVPPGSRIQYKGNVPWHSLLSAYASSTAALDLMEPNAEREIALAFRHVEYMACGLPIVTGAQHSLAGLLKEKKAGWVVEPADLEEVLQEILAKPEEAARRGRNAQRLAQAQFGRDHCEAPLLAWMSAATVREKQPTPIAEAAELAADLTGAQGEVDKLSTLLKKAEREVADKRTEVQDLSGQVRSLTSVTERLARAVDEVSGFKREAIHVLGSERDATAAEAETLRRELADLTADLAKKEAELRATARERDRAGQDLATAQTEAQAQDDRMAQLGERQAALAAENGRLRAAFDSLRAERDRLAAEKEGVVAQNASLSDDLSKTSQELAESNGELHRVHDKAGRFESELDRLNRELAALIKENERLSRRKLF